MWSALEHFLRGTEMRALDDASVVDAVEEHCAHHGDDEQCSEDDQPWSDAHVNPSMEAAAGEARPWSYRAVVVRASPDVF
ncbi:MAG: hypothetical protein ACHQ52_08125 [Candidatus Eisenbacteria bacterium]